MNIVEQVLKHIAMEEDVLSKEAVPTSSPPPLAPTATAANSWPSAPPPVTSSSSTSSNPSSVHGLPPGIVTPTPQARTPQHQQSISRTGFSSNGKNRTYSKSNTNSGTTARGDTNLPPDITYTGDTISRELDFFEIRSSTESPCRRPPLALKCGPATPAVTGVARSHR